MRYLCITALFLFGCALPTYDYRGVHVTLAEDECDSAYIRQQIKEGIDETLDTVGLPELPSSLVVGTEPQGFLCGTYLNAWEWAFGCDLWLRDDHNRPQYILRCDREGDLMADRSFYEPRKALAHWMFHRYMLEEGFLVTDKENKFHEDPRWQSYGYYCWEDHRILDNLSGAGTATAQCGW